MSQHSSRPCHGGVEAVFEVHERAGGPQPLADAVSGDDVPGLFEQQLQDFERLVLETCAPVRRAQFTGVDVEFEGAESDDWSHSDAPWGPSLTPGLSDPSAVGAGRGSHVPERVGCHQHVTSVTNNCGAVAHEGHHRSRRCKAGRSTMCAIDIPKTADPTTATITRMPYPYDVSHDSPSSGSPQ
jgi:hypothetical protein